MRHRNFALFASGQAVALIGYWVQSIAQSWLLYRLTGSATLLGLLGFASSIPILLIAPLAGLWSDRVNLHRAMFATQVLQMLQAIALAALAVAGVIEPWHIVTLAAIMGVLIAIEIPLRHAYLLELVGGKEDLANAIAVNSLIGNSGRLVGPSIAGVVIAAYGEAVCGDTHRGRHLLRARGVVSRAPAHTPARAHGADIRPAEARRTLTF